MLGFCMRLAKERTSCLSSEKDESWLIGPAQVQDLLIAVETLSGMSFGRAQDTRDT